jgi:hypothetical protein
MPPAPPPPGRVSRRLVLCLASFALTALVPFWVHSPLADLSAVYTDHVRQPYAAWVFLHRGLALYTTPLGELLAGITYPQAIDEWLGVPYVYPPGALALFLPLALVGRWVPLSQHAFGQVGILSMLALSHVALYVMWGTLSRQVPGGRALVGALAWLVLVRLGLQGQYDGAWLACGALALRALQQAGPERSLQWIALAALLHYRTIVLAPLGLIALLQAVQGRPWRRWPWGTLLLVAGVGAVCLYTFALMAPGARAGGAATASLLDGSRWTRAGAVLLLTLAATLLCLRSADALVVGLVLCGGALAFIDTHHWWHAAMLLLVPLAVGAQGTPRHPLRARAALVLWATLLQVFAWGGNPLWLFKDFSRAWRRQAQVQPPPT